MDPQNEDIGFCLHEMELYKVDLWFSPHEVDLEFGHHEVNVKLILQVPYSNVLSKKKRKVDCSLL